MVNIFDDPLTDVIELDNIPPVQDSAIASLSFFLFNNETNLTYWMFSYDFKSLSKEWVPEDKQLLQRKRTRNFLVFILYIIAFSIFLLLNSFTAHLLDVIVNPEFSYPV